MNQAYGRDLDLNLLRVFMVVAETGSVTAAGSRLYLTQPAISAAMKRLSTTVGVPLFARVGRGVTLTSAGKRLFGKARAHLEALVDAALSPTPFDPKTSERTMRIGLSDANEAWLLPPLLRALESTAPHTKLVVIPVQFRTVAEALVSGRIDLAVTVADEMPKGTLRQPLFFGGFTCVYDPRRLRLPKVLTRERYFAEEHVIVSYNGDLRGVVEDLLGMNRKVRLSVPTFHGIGGIVEGTSLIATIPQLVAATIIRERPDLATRKPPFRATRIPMELLWRHSADDDEAGVFLRALVTKIATDAARRLLPKRR